jgi:hypothetical protein
MKASVGLSLAGMPLVAYAQTLSLQKYIETSVLNHFPTSQSAMPEVSAFSKKLCQRDWQGLENHQYIADAFLQQRYEDLDRLIVTEYLIAHPKGPRL